MGNFSPRTVYESQREIVRAQPSDTRDKNPFADGAFPNLNGSSIPERAVHKVKNYVVFPDKLLARTGSKKWSRATIPPIPGRTVYSLTKSGTTVTKTVGTDFSASDVGSYIVYDDGKHERISAYLGTTQVTVEGTAAHAASTSAWIRGAKNARFFHREKKIFVRQYGTRIYYQSPAGLLAEVNFTADAGTNVITCAAHGYPDLTPIQVRSSGTLPAPLAVSKWYWLIYVTSGTFKLASTWAEAVAGTAIDITDTGTGTHYITPAWKEIPRKGPYTPGDTKSVMDELDNTVILFNSQGMFTIDLTNNFYYKTNAPIPTVRVEDVNKTSTKKYGRSYLYSLGMLSGDTSGQNRLTAGAEILSETGTVETDESYRDQGTVWTERPVGDAKTTYGVLTGATLVTPYDVSSGWSGISNGQFKISLDSVEYNCVCDFTGVASMAEVAARIQLGLRDKWADATCEYVVNHFVITNNDEGGTITVTSAGAGGTDIGSSIMKCQSGTGTVTTPTYTEHNTIGVLTIPQDPSSNAYQHQWDVYPVYGTLNLGTDGVDPVSGEGNNEHLFVWLNDVPAAKAFWASSAAGVISAHEGIFQEMDIGSKLRFENGVEVEIKSVVSGTEATTDNTDTIAAQAAAIGGDNALSKAIRLFTGSQVTTRITRTSGVTFSSSDVGKTIFWPDGERSLIIACKNANELICSEDQSISSTGACLDQRCRKYCDTIRDEVYATYDNLRSRIVSYSLQSRFFTPMPDCDMGVVTSSMLWGAVRGGKIVNYCAIDVNYRQLAGYFYEEKQREIFKDSIQEMSEVSDTLSVKCTHSTRAIPINTFDNYIIPQVGTAIIKATGQFMVAENIGVKHFGGVCIIDTSRQLVITSEPGLRLFSGREYGPNLVTNRLETELQSWSASYATSYDPINGFMMWGKDEE